MTCSRFICRRNVTLAKPTPSRNVPHMLPNIAEPSHKKSDVQQQRGDHLSHISHDKMVRRDPSEIADAAVAWAPERAAGTDTPKQQNDTAETSPPKADP